MKLYTEVICDCGHCPNINDIGDYCGNAERLLPKSPRYKIPDWCPLSDAPQNNNELTNSTHNSATGKICPSCKSGMSWQEIKSGKCWNCDSYIDVTGKLRQ